MTYSMTSVDLFWKNFSCGIFFLMIGHFTVATFLLLFSFVLIVPWVFFLNFLAKIFIGASHPVLIVTCWYVWRYVHTFSMPTVFWCVPVFPTSCAGILVLAFFIWSLFIFSWFPSFQSFIHLGMFFCELVTDTFDSQSIDIIIQLFSGLWLSLISIINTTIPKFTNQNSYFLLFKSLFFSSLLFSFLVVLFPTS